VSAFVDDHSVNDGGGLSLPLLESQVKFVSHLLTLMYNDLVPIAKIYHDDISEGLETEDLWLSS
jgi:hypothetical protein